MPGRELSFRAVHGKTQRLWPLMSDPLVCPARTWESAPELKGQRSCCPLFSIPSYLGTRCCETNFIKHLLCLPKPSGYGIIEVELLVRDLCTIRGRGRGLHPMKRGRRCRRPQPSRWHFLIMKSGPARCVIPNRNSACTSRHI